MPPDNFEGLLSEFVETFVVPAFPPADRLVAWSEALLTYYDRTSPVCIVRGSRRGELQWIAGERTAESDNSPGIWCFLRALDGTFDPTQLGDAIEAGNVPVLSLISADPPSRWNYSLRPLSPSDENALWCRGLKHCHVLPAGKARGVSPRQRALRNLNPANHFVFPNGDKRFLTERVGWTEMPAPADLGESPRVIAWVAWRLREWLGPPGAKVHDRYLVAAGGSNTNRRPTDAYIRIAAAAERHWTMNANLDYYIRAGEAATAIVLHLGYRRHDLSVEPIGVFVLNLADLAERGACGRRGDMFDVKIVRDDGKFWLSVRDPVRIRLSEFAARPDAGVRRVSARS
ncbi:MAG: hypothetical protein M3Z54_11150 [Gemmatimonadota bacterium]|nr:hypothetical protein [Gemmatimonadota bacterium]